MGDFNDPRCSVVRIGGYCPIAKATAATLVASVVKRNKIMFVGCGGTSRIGCAIVDILNSRQPVEFISIEMELSSIGIGQIGLHANVIRLQPPLILTEAQAEKACDVLEAAITAVAG